jgi:hypothetical protein
VRRFAVWSVLSAGLGVGVAAGCGGGGDSTGTPQVVDTVIVTPADPTIAIAGTVQLTATPRDQNGDPVTGLTVNWSSQDAGVATVSSTGLVTGVAAGTSFITATAGAGAGGTTVTVAAGPAGPLDTIVVSPSAPSVAQGSTVQLTATPQDSQGITLTGVTITWASQAPSVATVSATGLVSGVAPGTSVVTASAQNHTTSVTVTVTPPPGSNTVSVDGSTTFQTMVGWEATAQAGQIECGPAAFAIYKNSLFDQAVDLGINRLRVSIKSGIENPVDYFTQYVNGQITFQEWRTHWYEIVNDNADPNVIAAAGFQFSELDRIIDDVVLPMRQRLQARGEQLYVNLNYVDFGSSTFEHKSAPAEYGELILATFQHIQQRYGWAPNAVEVILEPDLATPAAPWTGTEIGNAILAANARLQAAGFTVEFIAPSNTSVANAATWFDQMIAVPGVAALVDELSYHRYAGVSDQNLQALATRAQANGMRTAMLEHIASDYNDLHKDLTLVRNSAWQQFVLAFCAPDNGAQYFLVNVSNPSSPVITLASQTRLLRQYFRWVRRGAQRVGASSNVATFDPIAFRNANGKFVVVVRATGAGSFLVAGLPAGTYGTTFTTASAFDQTGSDVMIGAGQTVTASIPAAGVITIYAK